MNVDILCEAQGSIDSYRTVGKRERVSESEQKDRERRDFAENGKELWRIFGFSFRRHVAALRAKHEF